MSAYPSPLFLSREQSRQDLLGLEVGHIRNQLRKPAKEVTFHHVAKLSSTMDKSEQDSIKEKMEKLETQVRIRHEVLIEVDFSPDSCRV
eukprot:748139-Hanusia_phi.AAC.2